jgi:hypothetical protein
MIKLVDILDESVNAPIYSIAEFITKNGINEISEDQLTRLEALIEKHGEEVVLEKFKSKAQLRYLYAKEPKIAKSWRKKHRKGEIERLPNRKHPKNSDSPRRNVPQKYLNDKSVRNALKSLGNN